MRGSQENIVNPEPIPPQNYRRIPFTIDGHAIQVVGMAKPDRGGHRVDESMSFIKKDGVDVILALEYKETYKEEAEKQGIEYENQHIEDFYPPTPEQCDEIFDKIRQYAREGKQVAIHCAAGMGRTGTVLAAIKLNELINDPSRVLQAESKTSMLKVSGLGGNRLIPCTPLVREAVDLIRSAQDSRDSVEVEKQIEMLCNYQSTLLARKNVDLTNKLPDFLTHDGIKMVIPPKNN